MRFDLKTSFASLEAKKVAEACDGYLEARKRRIDATREALIDAEMKRRLFRPKTRDAARRRLIDVGVFGEYMLAGESGAWWADKVEDLRALAIAAGDGEVFVSSEDAGVIANFLTPNACSSADLTNNTDRLSTALSESALSGRSRPVDE